MTYTTDLRFGDVVNFQHGGKYKQFVFLSFLV